MSHEAEKKTGNHCGKRQILIVDDELISKRLLCEILQSEYELLYCSDGLEALETIRRSSDAVSVVLLDELPDRPGDASAAPELSEADIKLRDSLERARSGSRTYSRIIRALAADYYCIYYVDLDSGRFVEYSSREEYRRLGIERSGDDFFAAIERNVERVVYEEDRASILDAMTKESIRAALSKRGSVSLTCRLLFDGAPIYMSIRVSGMGDGHIVVGISNIDEQVRREQELAVARERVYRDELTGVKSKHAFADACRQWNEQIESGTAAAFAVAMCDVNGLKSVNDTQGHKAGDSFLRGACRVICEVFKHSPVFRIGGDEFAVILSGSDYAIRGELLRSFVDSNAERGRSGGAVIACGMADMRPGVDGSFSEVLERADAAMYENKERLKLAFPTVDR